MFKRPQGQPAREYFYAYDTTGGRSGRPSIKSFFPEKPQSLENIGESFEPRYPIELTKDGAVSGGTFGRPFSSHQQILAIAAPAATQAVPRHLFVLWETFARANPTGKLKAHENAYGSPCPERIGYVS